MKRKRIGTRHKVRVHRFLEPGRVDVRSLDGRVLALGKVLGRRFDGFRKVKATDGVEDADGEFFAVVVDADEEAVVGRVVIGLSFEKKRKRSVRKEGMKGGSKIIS